MGLGEWLAKKVMDSGLDKRVGLGYPLSVFPKSLAETAVVLVRKNLAAGHGRRVLAKDDHKIEYKLK